MKRTFRPNAAGIIALGAGSMTAIALLLSAAFITCIACLYLTTSLIQAIITFTSTINHLYVATPPATQFALFMTCMIVALVYALHVARPQFAYEEYSA